jgi:hypothetical protein
VTSRAFHGFTLKAKMIISLNNIIYWEVTVILLKKLQQGLEMGSHNYVDATDQQIAGQ